jgi:hypothetical protein
MRGKRFHGTQHNDNPQNILIIATHSKTALNIDMLSVTNECRK